ncbi:LOW QUALITY PROTEIN: radial spoke head protein 9 homolog [Brienomyrus brachyistius]|uniref:LOW QUALITY PROTEIN: radial spoke head protein 9 homolog n=1 Tax=Brienomyrus brachyistius TaxID=42636 RepID=UPI0020B3E17B|nr:LOW QUALITY PROTEIN: radial spoke head protein 9 homolog [Brienomyrus brachyistius]
MDSACLQYALDLTAGGGLTLNCEQRAALQTSLLVIKVNYKFSRVLFWGKILGLKNDYFIAQGVAADEMKAKKILYSLDCTEWHLLPPVTAPLLADASTLIGRFTGDPSFEYEQMETRQQGEGGQAAQMEIAAGSTVKVNEEQRVAAVVLTIDREASVVPRGAFTRTPDGRVQTNRSFEGLSWSEAVKLSNYCHFTEPQAGKKNRILDMTRLDPSLDFLHSLTEDIPKGSWSLQLEKGSRVVVLRSLLWLGLSFFHVPMTPQHGYIYMGDGLKNMDLPFML